MGSGGVSYHELSSYAKSRGYNYDKDTSRLSSGTREAKLHQRELHPDLNPMNVVRECCDSEEHPNSKPVILALDVTGSMGAACEECLKALGAIAAQLFNEIPDVEFCIMGIGDTQAWDRAPIQMSQFESDIRILQNIEKVYQEMGGGGNGVESYTAAWYMGLYHTKLDCWKRGQKACIITMGDEGLNATLEYSKIKAYVGDDGDKAIDTKSLYQLASEKFDIYHLAIDHSSSSYRGHKAIIDATFPKALGENFRVCTIGELAGAIKDCINKTFNQSVETPVAEEPAVTTVTPEGFITF